MEKRLLILGLLLATFGSTVMAQEQSATDPLKNEWTVTQAYVPTVVNARRISETPDVEEVEVQAPEVNYSILKRQIKTSFELDPIKPAKMRGEPLSKLYRGYAKGGVGNYSSTYADVHINNSRSRKYSMGARVKHSATGGELDDVGFSGYSENKMEFYGKKFLRKHLLTSDVGYTRNKIHYYGYNPTLFSELTKADISQVYSGVYADAGIKSFYKDSAQVNYDINTGYSFFGNREHNLLVSGLLTRYMGTELLTLNTRLDYNNFNQLSSAQKGNGIFTLDPQITSIGDKWQMDLGLRIAADIDNSMAFHFYPNAIFKYNVISDLIVPYVGITGGLDRNSYQSLVSENPFIGAELDLLNTNRKLSAYTGVRGRISSFAAFNLGLSKTNYQGLPIFVNDLGDGASSTYTVLYDTVSVVNFVGEVSFKKYEKLELQLKGEFNDYDMGNELEAWHMPQVKVTFTGRYNLKDKIVLRADVYGLSEQYAKSYDPLDGKSLGYGVYAKKISGLVDLNVGAEYRYTKKLSAFLNLNNLGGVRYSRWNSYPTQRFNLVGGLTYSFWSK